jgi:hypothetical protein
VIEQLYTAPPASSVVVCLDEMGPQAAKSYPGQHLVKPAAPKAERARQEIDYGRRGTNEYTNGLLRRYFPKRTDFCTVSQEALNDVVSQINNIPRKVLKYKTPQEVFTHQLFQVLQRGYHT